MLTMELQISGGQVGRQLAADPEEAWYALVEMTDCAPRDFAKEVADHAHGHAADKVVKFLRDLAAEIEGRS